MYYSAEGSIWFFWSVGICYDCGHKYIAPRLRYHLKAFLNLTCLELGV